MDTGRGWTACALSLSVLAIFALIVVALIGTM
jgi:hypothetical protein